MSAQNGFYRQGDGFCSPDFEFTIDRRSIFFQEKGDGLHWHDYCEVEYVCAGSGEHVINNHRYQLQPGSVYIITPVDFHRVNAYKENPLELYHIQFGCSVMDETMMQRIIRTQTVSPDGIGCLLKGKAKDAVRDAFEQLYHEYEDRRPDGTAMMRSCLERLCIMILREAEKGLPAAESGYMAEDHAVINRAVQFIRYNFRSRITLSGAANQAHLSANYFGELFRRHMGMSFNAYLQKCRLEYAMRLLMDTKMNISEIAGESGFRTASYFSEIFRRHYGCSPTTFREKGQDKI
ncbi:MAG: AraC family transcriptional regulator [Clostridia bacterium]|nr:AraC family transcriptional regulator [Clostridia bacterium]